MPVTITKTVKSAGGDYSSLSAWEAAQQGDLPTLDEIHEAQCFGFVDTASVTVDGWTTNVTHWGRVFVDPTAVATLPYTTSGYRLEPAAGGDGITNLEDYFRFERLTIKVTASAGGAVNAFTTTQGAGENRLLGSLIVGVMNAANANTSRGVEHGGVGGNLIVVNTIVMDFTDVGTTNNLAFSLAGSGSSLIYAYNTLVYHCLKGYHSPGANSMITKNAIFDAAGLASPVAWNGGSGAGTDYNASSEAAAPGANSRSSQTFTYVNAAGGDLHLASGDAGAKNFGVSLSGDSIYAFAIDFDGVARPQGASWDIGPTEFAGAVATVTTPNNFTQPVPMRTQPGGFQEAGGVLALRLATSAPVVQSFATVASNGGPSVYQPVPMRPGVPLGFPLGNPFVAATSVPQPTGTQVVPDGPVYRMRIPMRQGPGGFAQGTPFAQAASAAPAVPSATPGTRSSLGRKIRAGVI